MTPLSAETVHRPNTTTLSTSSTFTGIWPDTNTQLLLEIQSHTSRIFHTFQVKYLECVGCASGCICGSMITTSAEEQSVMSTDWVATLGILNFVDLGLVPSSATCTCRLTPKQKGRHQGCFCSWTFQTGKNSQYEFLVSILTVLAYWLTGSMISDLLCYAD